MRRNLILASMALAAFVAFAAMPAVSSAQQLWDTQGGVTTKVPDNTKVTATLVTTSSIFTASTNVTCVTASITGEIKKASGTSVEGDITSANFSGHSGDGTECFSGLGNVKVTTAESLPWCIKTTPETDSFTVRGGKCSEAAKNLTFTFHVTTFFGTVTCRYERAGSVPGTVDTAINNHTTELTIKEAGEFNGEAGNSGLCPANGKLDMTFEMYTHDKHTAENHIFLTEK